MPESGHAWQRAFKGEPLEAAHVRLWTAGRVHHADAPLLAHELYVAVLSSGTPVIEMTLSTAGSRVRITALGQDPLPVLSAHGPAWRCGGGQRQCWCGRPDGGARWRGSAVRP